MLTITVMILLTAAAFNITAKKYVEMELRYQLIDIALKTHKTAIEQLPQFQMGKRKNSTDSLFRSYMMAHRSLNEPLSMINAEYILLDRNLQVITPFITEEDVPSDLMPRISEEIFSMKDRTQKSSFKFNIAGTKYLAVLKEVPQNNPFNLGWVIVYSSLEKINHIRFSINIMLIVILVLSAVATAVLSTVLSKRISSPFTSLNRHVRTLAERNFGRRITVEADNEISQLVNNINLMTDQLEKHDKARKTFLQNASHELRTPLMSIQGYAEGIKYSVVEDDKKAADIIMEETRNLSKLVDDLLYLSRLDAIEETYNIETFDLKNFLYSCTERVKAIAFKNCIELSLETNHGNLDMSGDEEKLQRAVVNILSNCIRYAKSRVAAVSRVKDNKVIEIVISDDGPGLDEKDIENIFNRFHKGKKGNFGLGLAITKTIIERHNGQVKACNSDSGAVFIVTLPPAF